MFMDFRGCGAPEFFGVNEPITARQLIADMVCAQKNSFCSKGSKVRFATRCLREKAWDCWEEVGYALGAPTIESMTWSDFVTIFRAEFASVIEVQQLAQEFEDLRQTNETMAEITTMFKERDLLVPSYFIDEEM